MKKENIVSFIQNQTVIAEVENYNNIDFLKSIGGKKSFFNSKKWTFKYSDKKELSSILTKLNDQGFYFLNVPHGWPPYAVFLQLRDEGFVDSDCKEITYDGKEYI